jgi:hypothetical protein
VRNFDEISYAPYFQGLNIEAKKEEEEGDVVNVVSRDPNRGNSEIYTSMQADSVATFSFSLD